jgi:RNA polymerase sigma-70 factor (ECF subfamily)
MEKNLDKKLYNDYLNGEKEAFNFLYNKYKSKIEYFIYNIVKDYQKAEDLTQETFIYVMQNEIKENCSFKYYVYLIAKSKAFNYINVENRRNEIKELYLDNNEEIEKDVLEIITKEETKKEVLEAIELLDEEYKNAIYLVNVEGLSYKETAEILGESVQNIKNLVHRGKKQLKKILLKKGFNEMNKVSKVIVFIVCTGIIVSGVVFAKDIQEFIKNKFNLSKGVETAIENGYIAESNDDYIFCNTSIEDETNEQPLNYINIGVKINSYLIDDSNLSMEISFKYDSKLKELVNIDNMNTISLLDLIIIDDENRILYDGGVSNKEAFENYCNENNLSYTFGNCNENYLNSGLNSFKSSEDSSENEISYIYNFYVEDENYPKSKKLNLIFKKIEFYEELADQSVVLSGDWNISLDIPEKMYNGVEGNYSVIKCENDNFDIYTAKVTETGFELGLIINGLENPTYPVELDEEEKRFYESISTGNVGQGLRITEEALTEFYTTSPYKDLYENYYTKHFPTSIKAVRIYMPWIEETEGCYIQNSNGNKYYISESGCAKRRNSFNEDNTYEFYNKFDMTQYDATDNIIAVIELYGSPVKIWLKRNS